MDDGPPNELIEEARAAEGLGYSTLQAFDQLALGPSSPVPILAFAAAITTTIRLSAYVFDNGYRHSVMLAKEAAALDQLSGGRLELGIGAGYSEEEYRGSGIPFPPGPERVAGVEKAIAVIKSLYREGSVVPSGAHHEVDGFKLPVVPIQKPWPPLMIAGARRRLLSLAGREADIASLAAADWNDNITFEATAEKIRWVRAAAGDRFAALEIETLVNVRFAATRQAAIAEAVARTGRGEEWFRSSPHWLGGSAEEMAETIRERRRDLGITYLSVRPRQRMREFAEVIRLLA